MKYRRFGKTELQIPVISCGGMRYQESWKDDDPVSDASQRNLEACINRSLEVGINHIETARGYGTSEYQLGKILPTLPRHEMIIQTKVGPYDDVDKFIATFEKSMGLLNLDYVDLFAFHGINNDVELERTKKCFDTALKWKAEGRIRHIGFSTHGLCESLVKTIETDLFEYVNLHWYYVQQDNWAAIEAATQRDMGVFIISPNDKGGKLYEPSAKMVDLCAPLHPMVFNGLYCLARNEVHTLSCGVSCPEDFEIHLETAAKSENAAAEIAPILARVDAAAHEALGEDWYKHCYDGLPQWYNTPGEINIQVVLRLQNLLKAFDMDDYAKMRYNLLNEAGSWFPGNNAAEAKSLDFATALKDSPFADRIPGVLAETHAALVGEQAKRLQQD